MKASVQQQTNITGYVDIGVESPELSLSQLIKMFEEIELPEPIYNKGPEDPTREQVGEIIYVELFENKNGVHVLRGGFNQFKGVNNGSQFVPT